GREVFVAHRTTLSINPTLCHWLNRYPRITVDADTFVEGAVIELTDDELVRVDHYEGSEYVRIVVTLTDDTAAWAYAEPPSDD
ncbi:MAG: gamma-glutamylcyclotransferase family protein, partial [Chloroflexota bacterium]